MCQSGNARSGFQVPSPVLWDVDVPFQIDLQPVDAVSITTVMDNITDVFMPDQGPARRFGPADLAKSSQQSTTLVGGEVFELPVAEHGFSVLVDVRNGDRTRRILFDLGTTPDGVVHNLRLFGVDPASIEAVVCSHGHFDHTAGMDGLIRTLGRANLPVVIHPHFWR